MDSQYIGRIVTFLQPLFVAAAGAFVTWIGTEVPGANLDGTELAGLFAVGAATAASAVYKWLDGRSKYEQAVVVATAAPDSAASREKALIARIEAALKDTRANG